MRKLTNSMRNKWCSCHKAFKFCYEQLIRPATESEALSFGTAMHSMLETYWNSGFEKVVEVTNIANAYADKMNDKYAGWTLLALYYGYVNRYQQEDKDNLESIGAEIGFEVPLMNPDTGATSKTFCLAGKIDAIAKDCMGRKYIVEHKTTGQDIGPGSDYWRKLPIDGQVSGYYVGAMSAGHEVSDCIYDVIRKPTIKPYKATPEESRKYKKDGTIYAGQREEDESPDEWFRRLSDDIASRPDFYFQRMNVPRSENDLADYMYDMWSVSKEIMEAANNNRYSRNPQACSVFGTCEYFDVCTGVIDINDEVYFMKVEVANPELK